LQFKKFNMKEVQFQCTTEKKGMTWLKNTMRSMVSM
jgi:hypothetical protein